MSVQLMLKRAVLLYVCAVDVEKGCPVVCVQLMLKRAVLLYVCAVDVEKGCPVVCLCS